MSQSSRCLSQQFLVVVPILKLLGLAVLWLSSGGLQAQDLVDVKQSLIVDIKQAQQRLTLTEKKISQEKQSLANKLQNEQQKVADLRQQTAVNRRLVDDQTLALSTIEARLKTWRDQDNYQKRLLLDLAQRLSLPAAKIEQVSENSLQGLAVLREYAAQKQAAINPQFSEKKVVYKTGEVILVNTLKLGPVQWFWNAQQQQGGLLDDDNNVQYLYSDKHNAQLAELYQKGRASLSFDPTLTRALQLSQQQESLWQHIERGGIWAMPIMFFALFALVIALTKVWQLWRLPPLTPLLVERIDAIAKSATVAELHQRLVQLQQQLQGAQKELVGIVLSTPESSQRDDKLLAYLIEHRQQLTTRLGAIAITAAVAPLLGLLGTVSGMIETFQMMNLFGAGDPSVVSGGISKALITTELGLVVAIPALILHALISRQIKHYNTQLDTTAIRLGNLETQQR